MEAKFSFIESQMKQETKQMKTSFQNIMATLEVETKNLSTNIENKKDQLKNLCAVFFAKIDNQISENQAIVSNI
jgi:hypothetical protein